MLVLLLLLETDAERERFHLIYERYRDKLYRVALKITRSNDRAQDAVQDAFCFAALYFKRVDALPEEAVEPYLIVIVQRTAKALRRADRLTEELPEDWDVPDHEAGPESRTEYERLVELVRAMPEIYSRALELKYVFERRNMEIAAELGISRAAVDQRISRGRKLLIEKLREEGYEA